MAQEGVSNPLPSHSSTGLLLISMLLVSIIGGKTMHEGPCFSGFDYLCHLGSLQL